MFFNVIQNQHRGINSAFHSGKIIFRNLKFNYLYDTGNGNTAKNFLKQLKDVDETIDVIFISHFDADHFGGYQKIIESDRVTSNTRVFLPFLTPAEKKLLIVYIRATNKIYKRSYDEFEKFIEFIMHPEKYNSRQVKYIPIFSKEDNRKFDEESLISNSDINNYKEFNLKYNHDDESIRFENLNWMFRPYVYKHNAIFSELLKRDITINLLKNNNYSIANCKKFKEELLDILKAKQISIPVNNTPANLISMSLYSGPKEHCFCRFDCYRDCRDSSCFPAWLHTGDSYLKDTFKAEFDEHYRKQMDYIGTFSLPHHASRYSCKENDILPNDYCNVIIIPHNKVCTHSIINFSSFSEKTYCTRNKNFTTVSFIPKTEYACSCYKSMILSGIKKHCEKKYKSVICEKYWG